MKNKLFAIALFCSVQAFSQQSESRTRLTTIASVGLVAGESSAKPLIQLSGGFSYGRYFSGIGIGMDQYRFNSIPLFADWRINWGKARLGFVYANAGYNFPVKNKSSTGGWSNTTDRFIGGFYADAGIGYRIRLSNPMHRLLFSAGYSQKTIRNEIGYTYECFVAPCPEQIYTYKYELGRIVAKFSWEFGR